MAHDRFEGRIHGDKHVRNELERYSKSIIANSDKIQLPTGLMLFSTGKNIGIPTEIVKNKMLPFVLIEKTIGIDSMYFGVDMSSESVKGYLKELGIEPENFRGLVAVPAFHEIDRKDYIIIPRSYAKIRNFENKGWKDIYQQMVKDVKSGPFIKSWASMKDK